MWKKSRKHWRGISLALVFMLSVSQVHAKELLVGAAASLSNAFKEIAQNYEKENPETTLRLSFAASDVLQQQILNGAPIDVFASADQTAMDKAVNADTILENTRKDFARNEIVAIVPAKSTLKIYSLDDLKQSSVNQIALGNPASVPAGRYAKSALEQANLWTDVQSKQVLGQNVRQVLDYALRNEVDMAFVFATDAALYPDGVKVIQTLNTPIPVTYPIAAVKRPEVSAKASHFIDYVLSPAAQAVLMRYGFSQP